MKRELTARALQILLPVLLLVAVVSLVLFTSGIQERLIKTAAIESANLYSEALAEFRTLYTESVVSRVNTHQDFRVSQLQL